MPEYPHAQALLDDARLRLDSLGPSRGILVVEGPDDKRVFSAHVLSSTQIVVSGGRTLLLAAHQVASQNDLTKIVFLTDCDFEVSLGTLRPTPSLVITTHADVEADLLELGAFRSLAVELVPAALRSDEDADAVAETLRHRAMEFATTLGQLRQIAKLRSTKIELGDLKYKRVRDAARNVNKRLLITKVGQQFSYCGLPILRFIAEVESMPASYSQCSGHDLVNALHFILREDYGISIERRDLARSLRMVSLNALDDWDVVHRLRKWEDAKGVNLFKD